MSRQFVLFWIVLLAAGCARTLPSLTYENLETGIRLEKPASWNAVYYERSGRIVLDAQSGIWQKTATRLEITGNACYPVTWYDKLAEDLAAEIERIRILYNLVSVTILQEPMRIEMGEYKVLRAIIAVPTLAMLGDQNRIQVSDRSPDSLQAIDIYAIQDQGVTVFAYIYEGDNDILNEQARKIVNSIYINCNHDP